MSVTAGANHDLFGAKLRKLLLLHKIKKTMKRLFFILLFFAMSIVSVHAQKLGGGLILGPTFSTMNISGVDSTRFRTDFCFGVRMALIPKRSVFGLELDVIYSRQGTSMKKGYTDNGYKVHWMEKSSYINVPLLLNVYLRKWNDNDEDESKLIRLRVGPQVGFCLKGDEVESIKQPHKTVQNRKMWELGSFNRIDYGITAAVSYWFVEVRYTYGLSNVFKEGEKSTNHVISVTWSDIW